MPNSHKRPLSLLVLVSFSCTAFSVLQGTETARADENGVSYWLPGIYGSMAAAPQTPGWAAAAVYIHLSVGASGKVAAAREAQVGRFNPVVAVNLDVDLKARGDLVAFAPSYVFATPVLGGQLAVSMTTLVGRSPVGLDGTLTTSVNGVPTTRQGSIDSTVTGFGDLYPKAELRWNAGVNNFMTYLTGGIPVGAYDPASLSNLGTGHAAIDAGAGYTYFDPTKGQEFSAVAGLTYNFRNPDTDYRNGNDFHLDLAAAQFLSKQFFIGAVGYYYQQLSDDNGAPFFLDGFRSRIAGAGPQFGYLFPLGDMQGYVNLKAYGEFAAENRPSGWNAWLTFSISPTAPVSTAVTSRQFATK